MTPAKYLLAVRARVAEFDGFGLPHFVQIAPKGKPGLNAQTQDRYAAWNTQVIDFVNANTQLDLHLVLHVYTVNIEAFPLDALITGNRALLPPGRLVFVTESGIAGDEEGIDGAFTDLAALAAYARLEVALATAIEARLLSTEVAMNHMAYNNYPSTSPSSVSAWINPEGITVKGQTMLDGLFPQAPAERPATEPSREEVREARFRYLQCMSENHPEAAPVREECAAFRQRANDLQATDRPAANIAAETYTRCASFFTSRPVDATGRCDDVLRRAEAAFRSGDEASALAGREAWAQCTASPPAAPVACGRELNPVCDVNGRTWDNLCLAQQAAVSVLYRGVCTTP